MATRGKNRVYNVAVPGQITSQSGPDYDYLYRVSTVRDSQHWPGDVVELADRKCIYAKSAGNTAMFAAHGCAFTYTGLTAYTAFATSYAVGVQTIQAPAATHAALDKDELRNGYIIIFDGASDYYTTTRQIVGNAESAENAAITLYLDASITYAITASTSACEIYRNPYTGLDVASNAAIAKAGKPMDYVPASESYFWVQKEGVCWIAPQSTVVGNEGTAVMWRHDGSLEAVATALTATVPATDSTQYAGYLLQGTYAGNGPLLMLAGM